jgi:DNA-binding PadR family transcriptional regulator
MAIDFRLVRSNLPTIVLAALSKSPIHGYALIKQIRQKYHYYCGASTMYPLLIELEEDGLVKSEWDLKRDRPCKVYTITQEGVEALRVAVSESMAIIADLRQIPVSKA